MDYKLINGFRVYGFKSKFDFIEKIKKRIYKKDSQILVAMNAEKIIGNNLEIKELLNSSKGIGYPDGIGCVLALKQKQISSSKISGSLFWLDIIKEFHKSKKFYLIGGTNEVINSTIEKLKNNFLNINIVGFRDGYINPQDETSLIEDIKSKKPDIIFIAQGSPKQEKLMIKLSKNFNALYMGLGGSFDVYIGNKKDAPLIFKKLYLEWFFRLVQDPKRILRLPNLIRFFLLLIFKKL